MEERLIYSRRHIWLELGTDIEERSDCIGTALHSRLLNVILCSKRSVMCLFVHVTFHLLLPFEQTPRSVTSQLCT